MQRETSLGNCESPETENLIAFKAEEKRSLWLERNEQEGGNTI